MELTFGILAIIIMILTIAGAVVLCIKGKTAIAKLAGIMMALLTGHLVITVLKFIYDLIN